MDGRCLLVWLVVAAGSCARPIVYQFSPTQSRSRRDIALVVASSGSGKERLDITKVDGRPIYDFFGDARVWIELPPGEHRFDVALSWSRTRAGSFYGVPTSAELEAGQCYQPISPPGPKSIWKHYPMHIEPAPCPGTWLSFPRVKQAGAPPTPM